MAEALAIQGCSTQLLDSLCQVLQFAKQDLSVQSNGWLCVCGPFLFLTIRRIYSNTNHATGSLCSKLKSVQCMYDICLYFVVGRSALALVAFSWTSHTSVMSKLLLTYDWSLEQAVQTRPWHRWCNANLLYVLGRVHSLPPCSESS